VTHSHSVRIMSAMILASLALTAGAQSREKRIAPVDPAQRESFSKATNVAVVVGVSDYASDTGLQKLQYADRDAQAIAAELRKQNYAVRLLVNSDATRSRITAAVREAGEVVTRDGTLLFFFSGHGFAPQGGRNYLATFGVTADELAQDGLSVDDLRTRIAQTQARRKVMFVDACRSEAGKGGTRTFASLAASSGLQMLLSTQMGRISYENDQLRQGVFTYFLLKALRGEAAGADGFVTFRDVSEYVTSSVRQWSFERNQTQIPVVLSDEVTGDFLLAKTGLPPVPTGSAPPTPGPALTPPISGSRVTSPVDLPSASSLPLPRRAPDLTIAEPSGRQALLSSFRGKVVVITFGTTACPHCQRESQTLTRLSGETASRGVQMLAVMFNDNAAAQIPNFIRDNGIGIPVGVATPAAVLNFLGFSAADRYVVPQVVVVDRDGMIRAQTGPQGDANLQDEAYLRRLIEVLAK
jgi:peroxiredoxin